MSTPITTVDDPAKDKILPLDAIPHFNLQGAGGFQGPYVFIGAVEDVCKHVEGNGIHSYYVMAYEEYKDDKKFTQVRPQIFKVLKSQSFRSVVPADPKVLKLDKITSSVRFDLPTIPYELIAKVDHFFRVVHKKHGTEAVVILTYDMDYKESDNPGAGWGLLIPKQENTAAACDYTPESVAADIPNESTYIVGSIHSHPGMSAYASGTDHKDQASFDGIHITIGWLASKNNVTEYHVELAIDGRNYPMDHSDVFAAFPAAPEDPTVEGWLDKVSKKSYTTTTSGSSSWSSTSTGGSNFQGAKSYYGSSSASTALSAHYYPKTGPDLDENTVIGIIEEPKTIGDSHLCPFCNVILTDTEMKVTNACEMCENYVSLTPVTSVEDLIGISDKSRLTALDQNHGNDIYAWDPSLTEDSFVKIYSAEVIDMTTSTLELPPGAPIDFDEVIEIDDPKKA